AIGRLAIEMLRGDAGRGIYAGVSSGQIFSLLVLVAIAARFAVTRRLIAIATTFVLVGNAHAQPVAGDPAPGDPPPATSDAVPPRMLPSDDDSPPVPPAAPADDPPPEPTTPPLESSVEVARLRPIFAVGMLIGGATAVNRPGEQVPDLSGESLSLGYIPGRFGLWFDLDRFSNSDATHDTALASVSFVPRITPHLWIGARAGIGVTRVSFMNPAFASVTASDVRIDAVAELVMNHNWVVWVRPLTVDVATAAELGGPITTLQFRAGIAYRFGERGHAVAAPPPQPAPLPTLEGP
ncbi:MAG TPA: hypothetical protein VFQ65_04865, partial [Kofleriaceae bacterium]|nr:hypothetical protein [Kofleriaceae bacterium]